MRSPLARFLLAWKIAGKSPEPVAQKKADVDQANRRHEENRVLLAAKIMKVSEKARELELEWQKIQQEEHDAFFAFQAIGGKSQESLYVYKKGIADGIKWCINHFS